MTAINGSSAKATQRRKRPAFLPCPDDGTKSLHQEQKTESGTISFLQLGQFVRTSGSGWKARASRVIGSSREREQIAPAVVVAAEAVVGPDDHGVGARRGRGHNDLRRRSPDAVPEEHAGRRHQADPGLKARRYRGHLAHAQRDDLALGGRKRPHVQVAQVDGAGLVDSGSYWPPSSPVEVSNAPGPFASVSR